MIKTIQVFIVFATLSYMPLFAHTAEDALPSPERSWSFDGPFGTVDKAAAQRGFQVFKNVCATCHSISLIRYRDLAEIGFNEQEIKAIAAEYETQDGPNDEGALFMRKSIPSDIFFEPYANEAAARAANDGSVPIDLSLITKARKHGADYLYALLTGYQSAPEGVSLFPGKYYNPYFPGGQIVMPPPLISEDLVTYADGTSASIEQMAEDVTNFLAWAAEPEMEKRKQTGYKMLIILAVLAILLYFLKKSIWRRVK